MTNELGMEKAGVTLYPDDYKNVSDKAKNDEIAFHLTKLLEITYNDQEGFKDKSLMTLYFDDKDGEFEFKIKALSFSYVRQMR